MSNTKPPEMTDVLLTRPGLIGICMGLLALAACSPPPTRRAAADGGALGGARDASAAGDFAPGVWPEGGAAANDSALAGDGGGPSGKRDDGSAVDGPDGGPINPGNASPTATAGLCDAQGWCWVHPVPQGLDLNGVWVASSRETFVVGASGTALHYLDGRWRVLSSGTNHDLRAVWGSAADEVFAVGAQGTIRRFDGSAWRTEPSGTTARLNDVWGSASAGFFAVGTDGTILARASDEPTWAPMTSPSQGNLSTIWGFGRGALFAGGAAGVLQLRDGTWRPMEPQLDGWVYALWGTSATDLWAAAQAKVDTTNGLANVYIYHFNGQRWRHVSETDELVASPAGVNALWGIDQRHIWAAGAYSDAAFFDGTSWSRPQGWPYRFVPSQPRAIHGSAPDNVWLVGDNGKILHFDGRRWQSNWTCSHDINAFSGETREELIAVTGSGCMLSHTNGRWKEHYQTIYREMRFHVPLTDVCANGSARYAVSSYGWVYAFEDGSWTRVESVGLDPENRESLSAVWCDGSDQVIAGGSTFTRYQRGQGWQQMDHPWFWPVGGIWGSSPSQLVAVGSMGTIMRYDGKVWAPDALPQSLGEINLTDVWGTAPNNIFAVGYTLSDDASEGYAGVILHDAGSGWTTVDAPPTADLRAIWGTGPRDIYVAGRGVVLHHDGRNWEQIGSDLVDCCRTGWTDERGVFVGGDDGAILYRAHPR
jgi:hypothetical protein